MSRQAQKSHNILLAADGTAKIADVGLARLLNQARLVSDACPMPAGNHPLNPMHLFDAVVWLHLESCTACMQSPCAA